MDNVCGRKGVELEQYPVEYQLCNSLIRYCPVSSVQLLAESRVKSDKSMKITDAPWLGDDVVGNFDPSRIPPRIAFRLEKARTAIEKEITDLLTAHGQEPLQ